MFLQYPSKCRLQFPKYLQKKWILAGGLSPENVISALKITNTENLDVNSGVEKSPGIKDKKKLISFFEKISL